MTMTQLPEIDIYDDSTWPVISVDLFKCCQVDGKYLGGTFIHDPEVDGDGPWFLVVDKDDVKITFGFGTKQQGLAAMRGLTHYVGYRYEYDVDETED